jgi:rRNA-processing protein FCF1
MPAIRQPLALRSHGHCTVRTADNMFRNSIIAGGLPVLYVVRSLVFICDVVGGTPKSEF